MNACTQRCHHDTAVLRKAIRQLDRRNSTDLHLPSRSAEFVLFETARLLEAIASSLERGDPVAHDVRENAERFARHIHRYIDVYLPTDK
jgi:hypothetical protein